MILSYKIKIIYENQIFGKSNIFIVKSFENK